MEHSEVRVEVIAFRGEILSAKGIEGRCIGLSHFRRDN
jgi:hypothetical protein